MRTYRSRRNNSSYLAFTLVELLVVISIIGILAALLLPSLARAKRHSKMVVCLNNLRQLGFSVEFIVQDTGKYPRGLGGHEVAKEFSCGTPDWARFQEMTNRPLFEYLNPYSKVFSCPEDKGFDFLPEGPFFGPTLYYAFGCSYKLNKAPWENTVYVPKGVLPGKPSGWVDRPSLYILIYEPPARPMRKLLFAPSLCKLDAIIYPYNYFHWHFNTGPASVFNIANDRQKAISPILFVDGHAAKHDFSRALRANPKYPTETTRDWAWYEPLPAASTNKPPAL